jgi:hypothetical protein
MAISILGIAAILFWGIPSIEQMRAQSQFDSVLMQFGDMYDIIGDLIHKTGGAQLVSISANFGSIEIGSKGERWIVSYCVQSGYDIIYTVLGDQDDSFTIQNNGISIGNNLQVAAKTIQGNTYTALNVRTGASHNETVSGPLNNGSTITVYLKKSTWASQPINGITLYFSISDNGVLIGEFYLFDAGYISYSMDSPAGQFNIMSSNGGTLASYPAYSWIRNSPFIRKNASGGEKDQLFMHMILINGSGGAGISGGYNYPILLSRTSSIIETTGQLAKKDVYKLRISVLSITGSNAQKWLDWLDARNYLANAETGSVMYTYTSSPSVQLMLFRTAFTASIMEV